MQTRNCYKKQFATKQIQGNSLTMLNGRQAN